MIVATLRGHIELQKNLLLMPVEVKKLVKKEMMRIGQDLKSNVQKNYLTDTSGKYLKVVTNALRGSTNVQYLETPVQMSVFVGTLPFYGKIHHEGFSGTVQRTSKVGKPTKPYVLTLKARPYLADAMEERKEQYIQRLQTAIGAF